MTGTAFAGTMQTDPIPKPLIIPVFIPHRGCPHRCSFCDQRAITASRSNLPSPEDLSTLVQQYTGYSRKRPSSIQLAFFGGNFLGLAPESVRTLLLAAAELVRQGRIDGIRFSTRPDTVDDQRLGWLEGVHVSAVELGVQSMDDTVLALSGRGHTVADTESAVALLKKHGYITGLQMMVGLPGDNEKRTFETGRLVAGLEPDFVRIYPTVVLKNSMLADWYRSGQYRPISLSDTITIVKRLVLFFRENSIPVIRIGLQASDCFENGGSILAGPYHPAFGHLVHSALFLDMARRLIQAHNITGDSITLRVHPGSISRIRGDKNQNINTLKNEFGLSTIDVKAKSQLRLDGLTIAGSSKIWTYDDLAHNI